MVVTDDAAGDDLDTLAEGVILGGRAPDLSLSDLAWLSERDAFTTPGAEGI